MKAEGERERERAGERESARKKMKRERLKREKWVVRRRSKGWLIDERVRMESSRFERRGGVGEVMLVGTASAMWCGRSHDAHTLCRCSREAGGWGGARCTPVG